MIARLCLLSTIVALAANLAIAQSEDVTFLVMGKTTNHRQSAEGKLDLLNYHFFAEIFVRDGGTVTNASLAFPNGDVKPFTDLDFVQEVHGGRYATEAELDREYPNGVYRFRFDTPSGNVDGRLLSVRGTGEAESRIPNPVKIHLSQKGESISSERIDPSVDLVVSWSRFEQASEDANGILDDLIFVVMGDCHGEKTVHSGRPFEGTGYLSFETTSYTIPNERLNPGESHQLFVEHARVDTSKDDDIVGLVTYAATSFLDFRTTGSPSKNQCPPMMPQIDGGQTDRPQKS